MKVGTALRAIRLQNQISKYRLAKLSGLSAVYINQLEVNQKSPTERTLKKLATALEVSVIDLLRQDEKEVTHQDLKCTDISI